MPDEESAELIATALEGLTPEQQKSLEALPVAERHMAHAGALWFSGYSMTKAATIAGVAKTTFLRRIQAAGWTDADRVNKLEAHEPLFHQIVQEGAKQQLEALAEGEVSLAQLTVTTGVAADKVIKVHEMRTKAPETPNQLANFFEQLTKRGVKRVSLEVEHEDEIDVTPSKEKP